MNPQLQQAYSSLMWLVLFSLLMYFLILRPQKQQQRKHFQMIASIKVGDRIITTGGMVGTVTQVRDESLTVKIADRVEIELMKSGVAYVREK